MFKDWLNANYFRNSSGGIDTTVDSLSDCLSQTSYVIGKLKFGIPDFYRAYLNESTLKLEIKNDEILYFGTIDNVWIKGMIGILQYNEGITPSDRISGVLKNGDPAIIHPIVERLSFQELYDLDYNDSKPKSDHYFSIIGEDKDNLFFVDNPAVINMNKFTPYKENSEVGIISKKDFDEALADFCEVGAFVFDLDKMKEASKQCEEVFRLSYNNYNKKSSFNDDVYTFYGAEAIEKLAELFEKGDMYFSQEAPSHDRDIMKYFLWRIWHIKGRRKLQVQYLREAYRNDNRAASYLVDALMDSVKFWDLLNNNLYKNFLKGKERIDSKYVQITDEILTAENKMNQAYRSFIETI